jgi:hypothetical protein
VTFQRDYVYPEFVVAYQRVRRTTQDSHRTDIASSASRLEPEPESEPEVSVGVTQAQQSAPGGAAYFDTYPSQEEPYRRAVANGQLDIIRQYRAQAAALGLLLPEVDQLATERLGDALERAQLEQAVEVTGRPAQALPMFLQDVDRAQIDEMVRLLAQATAHYGGATAEAIDDVASKFHITTEQVDEVIRWSETAEPELAPEPEPEPELKAGPGRLTVQEATNDDNSRA